MLLGCVATVLLVSAMDPRLAMMNDPRKEAVGALRDTKVAMCRAVVTEMHIEIHKHKLRKNGEDDIYDTVPAICLAIVQNYTLDKAAAPNSPFELVKRATKLDDDDSPSPAAIVHLMTLKHVCEQFADEFQQELSELMYKKALDRDAEAIVEEFCASEAVTTSPPPPPPPPKKRAKDQQQHKSSSSKQKKERAGEKKASREDLTTADGSPDMEALLRKYDTDGAISNLMEVYERKRKTL
jgi:hypothetical protein